MLLMCLIVQSSQLQQHQLELCEKSLMDFMEANNNTLTSPHPNPITRESLFL